nr:MarR family transcriptional regulator [Tepidicella baoligensis]
MTSDAPATVSFDFANAPGHLIRRAHQVSVALFTQEAAAYDVTQVQFAILNALIDRPGLDQVSLAQAVALDAATSGSVIGRLEAKGWIQRERDTADRRRRLLWVTEAGQAVVAALMVPIARSQDRLMAPLDAQEQVEFKRLLRKVFMRGQDHAV